MFVWLVCWVFLCGVDTASVGCNALLISLFTEVIICYLPIVFTAFRPESRMLMSKILPGISKKVSPIMLFQCSHYACIMLLHLEYFNQLMLY